MEEAEEVVVEIEYLEVELEVKYYALTRFALLGSLLKLFRRDSMQSSLGIV